ncbi:MAG TPA: YabP/YqfC family sporulation protein [Firmicutes bacterium]|nr:YabP/YqfC family sporulation protein [Bacillota bacterium]
MKTKRRRRLREPSRLPAYSISSRVEKALELPVGSLSDMARIELSGNRRAVIEGCRGIVEYGEEVIRLSTDNGIVRFMGRSLHMNSMTEDRAVIEGIILSLEYLS